MISTKLIQSSLEDLKEITKADFCVADLEGRELISTFEEFPVSPKVLQSFLDSEAQSQMVANCYMLKCEDAPEPYLLLVNAGGGDGYQLGRIAVSAIGHLLEATRERVDKDSFYQSLLSDNLSGMELYNKAGRLNIKADQQRVVYVIEVAATLTAGAKELLRNVFSDAKNYFFTALDERSLILIRNVTKKIEEDELRQCANQIVSTINTELMGKARVSYGTIASELKEVTRSYREARAALEVSAIFCENQPVAAYAALGIGRLIYQLPTSLCEMFIKEIFGDYKILEIEEKDMVTINTFFEKNLNVSETARELYMHRNTLVYHLEKLERTTGLDIRRFDEAMTFKIAMMVARYLNYKKSSDN